MKSAEYQSLLDSLPYGKRLPGAIYLLDPGSASDALPAKLRVTVAELRKRLDIGPDFNLLKFHTASPKISFLAYPAFDKDPHPALAESIIVDLVTGKIRRDDYRGREHGLREETIGHGMTEAEWSRSAQDAFNPGTLDGNRSG